MIWTLVQMFEFNLCIYTKFQLPSLYRSMIKTKDDKPSKFPETVTNNLLLEYFEANN